ncbi:hypothetical protein MFIFM68171_04706 [Madurella fahalii]|uniref:Uncharacterized protein n=1 Tax=Madurella fahalii TaxID=1157608 RepID=A0ABQ0G9T6_9PEZI
MVPMHGHRARGRRPAPAPDLSDDDDWTVYSDTESIFSRSTASDDSFSSSIREDTAPVLTLGKDDFDKSVYEAWNITFFPDKRVSVAGYEVLGLRIQKYDDEDGNATIRGLPSAQSELASMHLRAVEEFRARHKRCWAVRAVCGKTKTYEQDLDERCRKLPAEVRAAMSELLSDRGKATSSRYRTRTWTVVSMREQLLHHRFAQAEPAEVKRHKIRFWKNPDAAEPLVYTVIIRGAESKACADINSFAPFTNPWRIADNAEVRRKSREQRREREALRYKANSCQPRGRSLSPPSYRSSRSRYGSPAPTSRASRYESPPPYPSPRCHSPVRSDSPVDRIRVVRRRIPSFDGAPSPPTPPKSYTPPPGVSAYGRPTVTPPPPPPPPFYGGPFHLRQPVMGNGFRNYVPAAPFARPQFTFEPRPLNEFAPPPMPATCPGCRTAKPCQHFSPNLPCYRPMRYWGGIAYHQPCVICSTSPAPSHDHYAGASPASAPMPPPAPSLPPLSTPSLSTLPSRTPPLPNSAPWLWPPASPPSWSPPASSTRLSTPGLSTSQSTAPESQPDSNPASPGGNPRSNGPAAAPQSPSIADI